MMPGEVRSGFIWSRLRAGSQSGARGAPSRCCGAAWPAAARRAHPRPFSPPLYPPPAVAKAKGVDLRIHFKNVVEVAAAVRGMKLDRAQKYLNNVLEKSEAIPIRVSKGGRGRHAQAKAFKTPGSLCFWPKNATRAVLDLLTNAAANAETMVRSRDTAAAGRRHAGGTPTARRRHARSSGHGAPCRGTRRSAHEAPRALAAVPRARPRRETIAAATRSRGRRR